MLLRTYGHYSRALFLKLPLRFVKKTIKMKSQNLVVEWWSWCSSPGKKEKDSKVYNCTKKQTAKWEKLKKQNYPAKHIAELKVVVG